MSSKYRAAGTLTPDAGCLLDVLAAAGAACLSKERFSFCVRGTGTECFPQLTEEHALACLTRLREEDASWLSGSPVDFLRGAGKMPMMAERVRKLAQLVSTDDIRAWAQHRAALRVSLRLETSHVSDVPAGQRAQGSAPVERYSHPGRNALAAFVLMGLYPPIFVQRTDWKPNFFTPRIWAAPVVPMSYERWSAIMAAGPRQNLDVEWFDSQPRQNGKAVCL